MPSLRGSIAQRWALSKSCRPDRGLYGVPRIRKLSHRPTPIGIPAFPCLAQQRRHSDELLPAAMRVPSSQETRWPRTSARHEAPFDASGAAGQTLGNSTSSNNTDGGRFRVIGGPSPLARIRARRSLPSLTLKRPCRSVTRCLLLSPLRRTKRTLLDNFIILTRLPPPYSAQLLGTLTDTAGLWNLAPGRPRSSSKPTLAQVPWAD